MNKLLKSALYGYFGRFGVYALSALFTLCAFSGQALAADLHGRVIDRGTLRADGSAKGVAGIQVSAYDGKKLIGSAVTNGRGTYRIRKVTAPRVRAIYQVRGSSSFHPSQVSRSYLMAAADTASRDVYLDAAPREKPESGKGDRPAKGGYYPGLARGFLALARQEAFFREDTEDSALDLSAYFDARDTSSEYVGVMCELLWAEFLSQDRPLETRYYLASALFPMLDSLKWGRLQYMRKYLDVNPEAVREVANAMREAIRNPKKLPNPKDVRKAKAPLELASQIASEYLSDGDLPEKAKDRFLARWKKS
jgi:hypothetical protein